VKDLRIHPFRNRSRNRRQTHKLRRLLITVG
jgi:hypothetical protein